MWASTTATAAPAVALRGKGAKALSLKLRADRLSYRPCKARKSRCAKKLDLKGKVRIAAGRLRVRAARVELLLDRAGRPLQLEARGSVALRLAERRGRADRLLLLVPQRRVELSGKARLRCPQLGLTLDGARITVELDSGRLVVQQARAAMRSRRGR